MYHYWGIKPFSTLTRTDFWLLIIHQRISSKHRAVLSIDYLLDNPIRPDTVSFAHQRLRCVWRTSNDFWSHYVIRLAYITPLACEGFGMLHYTWFSDFIVLGDLMLPPDNFILKLFAVKTIPFGDHFQLRPLSHILYKTEELCLFKWSTFTLTTNSGVNRFFQTFLSYIFISPCGYFRTSNSPFF